MTSLICPFHKAASRAKLLNALGQKREGRQYLPCGVLARSPSIVLSGRLSAFRRGQASTLTLHRETSPAGCTGSHKPYLIVRKPEPSWLPA